MRIALCFSGQVRSFNLVKENLKKYIMSKNNEMDQIDIFCHTYYKYDNSKYKNFYNENCSVNYGNYNIDFNEFINFFQPVSFKLEYPYYPQNSKSMFYSIYKCNELKKEYETINNFKYDIVVRLRYDFYPTNYINYTISDKLFIIDRPTSGRGLCDVFAYSSSKTMDTYSKLFKIYEFEKVIEQRGPEILNELYINNNNIITEFVDKSHLHILRNNGDILKL